MIVRVIGLIMAFIGFLMLKFFPDIAEHQTDALSRTGILIGLIFILVGIILLVFGW